jgi:hypothetical protein
MWDQRSEITFLEIGICGVASISDLRSWIGNLGSGLWDVG